MLRASLLTAAVVILTGCVRTVGNVGAADVERTVREVSVEGNEAVEDDDLVDGLSNRPPEGIFIRTQYVYDPLALRVDKDRIERYYHERGYFSANVVDTDVAPVGDEGVDVRFRVEEGEPTILKDVVISGPPEGLEWKEVKHALRAIEEGRVYSHQQYMVSKNRLQSLLYERGYAHSEVSARVIVDRDERTAVITFDISAGPLAKFGETRVEGNELVTTDAVLARVAWNEGEAFSPRLLELTRGRLYKIGNFSTVRITYEEEGRPEVTDMTIHVDEGFRHKIQLGGGVAMDQDNFQVRARAAYTQYAFLRPLTTLRLDARPAYLFPRDATSTPSPGGEARATLIHQDVLFPRLRLEHWIDYSRTELETYGRQGPGARVELSRPFAADRLNVGVGWEIHRFGWFDVSCAIGGPGSNASECQDMDAPAVLDEATRAVLGFDEDRYRVAYFDQSIAYDRRDHILDPTNGFYLELGLEEGGSYAGGQFDYVSATGEARGYLPVTDRMVLAQRVRYGRALQGDLPITRRFFAGGAASHRGFSYRHLSPTVESGDYVARFGGEESLLSSSEIRYELFQISNEWFGVVLFGDGGDVPIDERQVQLSNLHWAVGLGLRYDTIVGPVRVDLGRRVTRTGAGEPAPNDLWAFHFSLGEAF